MTRIFTTLAVLLTLAFLVTFGVGLYSASLPGDPGAARGSLLHFTLGLFTSLGALLVHCIIFTYFLGTGRWVKEVGFAYNLPDANYPKTTRELKRTVFPAALFAMLITIATAAAGGGLHTGVWHWSVHLALGALTVLINLWAFRIELRCLNANAQVIEGVQNEAERIRAERGLPSSAEDFQRQNG
jgi:hypothetical protein